MGLYYRKAANVSYVRLVRGQISKNSGMIWMREDVIVQ